MITAAIRHTLTGRGETLRFSCADTLTRHDFDKAYITPLTSTIRQLAKLVRDGRHVELLHRVRLPCVLVVRLLLRLDDFGL